MSTSLRLAVMTFSGVFRKLLTIGNFVAKIAIPLVATSNPNFAALLAIFVQVDSAIQTADLAVPLPNAGAVKSMVAMSILEKDAAELIKQTEILTGRPMVDQNAFEDFVKLLTDAQVALYKAHGIQGIAVKAPLPVVS